MQSCHFFIQNRTKSKPSKSFFVDVLSSRAICPLLSKHAIATTNQVLITFYIPNSSAMPVKTAASASCPTGETSSFVPRRGVMHFCDILVAATSLGSPKILESVQTFAIRAGQDPEGHSPLMKSNASPWLDVWRTRLLDMAPLHCLIKRFRLKRLNSGWIM